MTDAVTNMIRLDPAAWMDTPQIAIDAFSAARPIIIDASGVNEISAQVAQLLISGHRTAKSRSEKLHLHNPTEGVLKSLELMGLKDLLLESNE